MSRILTALILIPLVLLAFFLGGFYLLALLVLVSVLCCYEASLIISPQDRLSKILAMIFCASFFLALISFSSMSIVYFFAALFIFHAIALFNANIPRARYEKFSTLFFWCFYIVFPIACAFWLVNRPTHFDARVGVSFVLVACVATFMNDTFAYFCGRAFGKNPLFLRVSSKKTWEGFLGGGLLSTLALLIVKFLPMYFGFDWLVGLNIFDLLWISLPAIMLAPFGDLVESRLKRIYDTKDSSNILPGHGGFLDRIDGLLMVMPWTALYAFIIRPLCS